MFALGILIGIYSYVIFSLGILGILYKETILISTIIFIILSVLFYHRNRYEIPRLNLKKIEFKPLLLLFIVMAVVNLIGALGPELSFDALWYHLTLPKIFLEQHKIEFLPGNLFYYSVMPKLGDMLYVPALAFGNEIIAKLIQWSFGILTSYVIYVISRKYFPQKIAFFAVLIFYGSLVVAWESTVAYIDLIRTFFEIMSVWGIINYFDTKDRKWLLESGIMMGLAIATKMIAITSLPLFAIFFLLFIKNKRESLKNIVIFVGAALLVASPWFIFAFVYTGNPFYPLFTDLYPASLSVNLINPVYIAESFYNLFFRSEDPISPIYIIVLPLYLVYYKKVGPTLKFISIYSFLALVVWYLVPRTGGGRFILPYLPALSILSVGLIVAVRNIKLQKYLFVLVIIVCFITVFYRGIANSRYLPVILGIESKREFLTNNLNFGFGDFYDTDEFFRKNIKSEDKVLLYGFHNLYYADFPYIHHTYAREGDKFNYIATQNSELPFRFSYWELIHSNKTTNVNVYSLGGQMWSY
jgi:4-amino-4-deoxy-L-arabinose transferase-like glycosyltransferase